MEGVAVSAAKAVATTAATKLATAVVQDGIELVDERANKQRKVVILSTVTMLLILILVMLRKKYKQ